MFGFNKKKQLPEKLAELKVEHLKQILQEKGGAEAGKIARRAAAEGSTDSAVFISVALMQAIQPGSAGAASKKLQKEFLYYTALAARRGDAGSQFNMAKHFLAGADVSDGQMSVEGFESLCRAEYWYKKAAGQGLPVAREALARTGPLFSWARSAFTSSKWEAIGQRLEGEISLLIAEHGLEVVVNAAAQEVIDRLLNEHIAYEFSLQELDGASQGNDYSRLCAALSGIPERAFKGSLSKSIPEIDGPDGPQQYLLQLSLSLAQDRELMAKFRCDVGSVVRKHFKLGLHSPT